MRARYRIVHRSLYEYDRDVHASYNEARLTPQQAPWQSRLESTITVDPVTWSYRYEDYWGNAVRVFEVEKPHSSLEVRAVDLVELDPARRPGPRSLGWGELSSAAVRDRYVEFLAQTPATTPPGELAERAQELAGRLDPVAAARAIGEAVHDAVTYRSGVTAVHTTAVEAWRERSGVCQDYAHLVVGALRHVGVPARYVSGYLYPQADPAVGDSTSGESHAWVEFWTGEWSPHDPTNLAEVADRHVTIGSGRDYSDVPPIKGIVAGSHETRLTVTVELARVA
jgi:transglutaminase-like putative cysteine protease